MFVWESYGGRSSCGHVWMKEALRKCESKTYVVVTRWPYGGCLVWEICRFISGKWWWTKEMKVGIAMNSVHGLQKRMSKNLRDRRTFKPFFIHFFIDFLFWIFSSNKRDSIGYRDYIGYRDSSGWGFYWRETYPCRHNCVGRRWLHVSNPSVRRYFFRTS